MRYLPIEIINRYAVEECLLEAYPYDEEDNWSLDQDSGFDIITLSEPQNDRMHAHKILDSAMKKRIEWIHNENLLPNECECTPSQSQIIIDRVDEDGTTIENDWISTFRIVHVF